MKAGALSDSKVIETLNNDFIPVHIDLSDRNDPTAGEQFKKYSQANSIPQIAFVTPDGKHLKEQQIQGLVQADQLLERLNQVLSSLLWHESEKDATAVAKKQVKPLVAFSYSEASKEEFRSLSKQLQKQYGDKLVWYKQITDKKEKGILIKFSDPFSAESTSIDYSDKEEFDKSLRSMADRYITTMGKYMAKNTYHCEGCGKTGNEQKECCGANVSKVKTFTCEKCSKASGTQENCCGSEMKPITE